MRFGTSYFGNRILRHVAADMKQLREQGFNQVTHTYNENDMLFYHRTMKEIVRITKEEGHEVHIDPWGVGKVFGGESFSNFVACNLDALQVLSDDKPAGMACPMNPRFRAFMVEWIEAAIDLDPDFLFWDEPHFSIETWIGGRKGQWGCRCPICQDHFREQFGYAMPSERTKDVADYLEWGIHDFLTCVIGESAKRGMKNNLCLLPHEQSEHGGISIWDRFAAIPGLHVFGTDPYFVLQKKGLEHVSKFTSICKSAADKHNLDCQIWHQGFKIAAGQEKDQAAAVQIAWDLGVRNHAVWGFEACDHMGWIRPDDPARLWEVFLEKFSQLKN